MLLLAQTKNELTTAKSVLHEQSETKQKRKIGKKKATKETKSNLTDPTASQRDL